MPPSGRRAIVGQTCDTPPGLPRGRADSVLSLGGAREKRPGVPRSQSETPGSMGQAGKADAEAGMKRFMSQMALTPLAPRRRRNGSQVHTLYSGPLSGYYGDGDGYGGAGQHGRNKGDKDGGAERSYASNDWHFGFDRALLPSSYEISAVTFTSNGRYMLTGGSTGNLRIWDTDKWAEVDICKNQSKEPMRAVTVCSALRWLATVQASTVAVYKCGTPWHLQEIINADVCPLKDEVLDWCCGAFAPSVDEGRKPCLLALFNTTKVWLLDYTMGWGQSLRRRTHSLTNKDARPTAAAFSPDGEWIVCSNERGAIEVWNAKGLNLAKTLEAHTERVNDLIWSPVAAMYERRMVSCGKDGMIQVWLPRLWMRSPHPEYKILDAQCGRAGVRACGFSCRGQLLVSIGRGLCIWKVVEQSGKGKNSPGNRHGGLPGIYLEPHQRMDEVSSARGLRVAAFSAQDGLIIGSCDGALSLWVYCKGFAKNARRLPFPDALVATHQEEQGQEGEAFEEGDTFEDAPRVPAPAPPPLPPPPPRAPRSVCSPSNPPSPGDSEALRPNSRSPLSSSPQSPPRSVSVFSALRAAALRADLSSAQGDSPMEGDAVVRRTSFHYDKAEDGPPRGRLPRMTSAPILPDAVPLPPSQVVRQGDSRGAEATSWEAGSTRTIAPVDAVTRNRTSERTLPRRASRH